jgi:hypothetical protein
MQRRRGSALVIATAIIATIGAVAAPARAETAGKALFEITLDIDRDGKPDRAVLVTAEGVHSGDKDWLMIGRDQRVDLHIYLGGGDAPLDLSREPTFIKRGLVTGERQNQVFPLETTRGSLIVKTAYNLHSNWVPETLTIAHRKGEFLVAGWRRDYEMKDGAQGGCEINFLSGTGTVSKGLDGRKRPLRGRFTPVKLGAWTEARYLKLCGGKSRMTFLRTVILLWLSVRA